MKHFTLYFSILLNKQGASYPFNFRSLAKTTFVFFFVFLSLNGFSSSVKADSTENFKLQITLLAGYPNHQHHFLFRCRVLHPAGYPERHGQP